MRAQPEREAARASIRAQTLDFAALLLAGAGFEVEVLDPVEDYVALLRQVFDMGAIRALLARCVRLTRIRRSIKMNSSAGRFIFG